MSKWVKIDSRKNGPHAIGCYVIYDTDKTVKYIGSSSELFKRFKYHNKLTHHSYSHIKYCITETIETAIRIEYLLINRIRPKLNKSTTSIIAACFSTPKLTREELLKFPTYTAAAKAYFGVKGTCNQLHALFYYKKWTWPENYSEWGNWQTGNKI